jgi:hypothetical protein
VSGLEKAWKEICHTMMPCTDPCFRAVEVIEGYMPHNDALHKSVFQGWRRHGRIYATQ